MPPQPGILLQARYGSTRLRGKVLERIGSRTIVEHCLRRLLDGAVARVVLATTRQPEDDALVAIASRLGVAAYRGDTEDVLGRFAEAADAWGLDPVLRATADNPAVDEEAPRRVLEGLRTTQADYIREEGVPLGASVEGMTAQALRRSAKLATDAYDREHVTTFMRKRRDLFRVTHMTAPARIACASLRLTIDTPADLAWVRELFARVGTDDASVESLIAVSGCRASTVLAGSIDGLMGRPEASR
jgi:spore coat polysaccharide biosynthesis protein SpsF